MDTSQDEFINKESTANDSVPYISPFLLLPLEIKASIMKMLAAQDLAYRIRTKDQSKKIAYGRSLNMMFEVNKELSELAAVHIFDVSCNLIAR